MKWKQRPSTKELFNKLQQARVCLKEGKYLFGPNLDKLVDDFLALHIGHSNEIWPLIAELLEEITPDHYAGTHPPMKALEGNLNCELFVFVWESKKLRKSMYIKFAIKDEYFYYFSLHKSQRPDKCWKFVDNFQKSVR